MEKYTERGGKSPLNSVRHFLCGVTLLQSPSFPLISAKWHYYKVTLLQATVHKTHGM